MIKNFSNIFLKKIIGFALASVVVCACYGSDNNGNVSEEVEVNAVPDHPDVVSRIKTDVKDIKSKRGIRILYMHDDGAPIVQVRIAFRNCGTAYQQKEKAGVAGFYAKSVLQGCGKYSPAAFDKAVSDLASRIACTSNRDLVTFFLTAPKVVLNDTVKLLNLAFTDPKFEEDKVKIIKNSLVGFLQDYSSDPRKIATIQIIPSIIFKGHPYERGGLGSAEDFAKLSIDDIKTFKSKYIVAKNAEVCVFGAVSEEEAIALVDKIFENVADGSKAPDSIQNVSPKLEQMQKKYYVPGPQSAVFFILKGEKPGSKDAAVAQVVATVLGGPILTKSKVLGILRGKLGYIYTGRVGEEHRLHSDCLIGTLLTDNNKVANAIDALKKIVKELREKGITQDELDFAKGFINGSTLVGLRTSGRLCDFYFGKMLEGAGVDALREELKAINEVTLEDVREYCKKTFDENLIPFFVIGGNADPQQIQLQQKLEEQSQQNQQNEAQKQAAEGSAQ